MTASRAEYLRDVQALREKARDHMTALLVLATEQTSVGLRASLAAYAREYLAAIERWEKTEPVKTYEQLLRTVLSRSCDDIRRELAESWARFQRMTPAEQKADIAATEESTRQLAKQLANANAELAEKNRELREVLQRNVAVCEKRVSITRTALERAQRKQKK